MLRVELKRENSQLGVVVHPLSKPLIYDVGSKPTEPVLREKHQNRGARAKEVRIKGSTIRISRAFKSEFCPDGWAHRPLVAVGGWLGGWEGGTEGGRVGGSVCVCVCVCCLWGLPLWSGLKGKPEEKIDNFGVSILTHTHVNSHLVSKW